MVGALEALSVLCFFSLSFILWSSLHLSHSPFNSTSPIPLFLHFFLAFPANRSKWHFVLEALLDHGTASILLPFMIIFAIFVSRTSFVVFFVWDGWVVVWNGKRSTFLEYEFYCQLILRIVRYGMLYRTMQKLCRSSKVELIMTLIQIFALFNWSYCCGQFRTLRMTPLMVFLRSSSMFTNVLLFFIISMSILVSLPMSTKGTFIHLDFVTKLCHSPILQSCLVSLSLSPLLISDALPCLV